VFEQLNRAIKHLSRERSPWSSLEGQKRKTKKLRHVTQVGIAYVSSSKLEMSVALQF